MSIVIDARFVDDELSGITRYTIGLLRGLMEVADQQIIAIERRPGVLRRHGLDIGTVHCNAAPFSPMSQVSVPRVLQRVGAKVYHAPYLIAPLRRLSIPVVVTIHDLIPHRCSKGTARSWKTRFLPVWRWWTQRQCRCATAIVTVSDFSRYEIIEEFNIPPEDVTRIYNGVDSLGLEDPQASTHGRWKLSGRIISYIGRHDPYKNVETLLRATARARHSIQDPFTLMIAGRRDPRYPDLRKLAHELGLDPVVQWLGYITEAERRELLYASDVFVYPSKYEGFGLPPLEAMAAGVPVVSSNATSLPEILGDAATLVNPDDSEGMARAIAELLNDGALRVVRTKAGLQQAARFSWRQCASEHLELYNALRGRVT